MAEDGRTGSCVICQTRDPLPELAPACGPCRSRLAGQLRDIPQLVGELSGGGFVERDLRHREEVDDDGRRVITEWPADPVAHYLTAGPINGQSNAPRVQGSREAPVPISVDRTDLLSDARVLNLTKVYPEQREDQIGYLSAAAVLDGWCRDFAETRRESVPEPTPAKQCRYLGDRLDWAFTDHAAVDEFAGEVADLWHVLRRACGLTMPQPELCIGVECKACDLRMLYRIPGSPYVECQCGQLYTEDEYRDWTKLLAAQAKRAHGEL
jgi:hypothetical protein